MTTRHLLTRRQALGSAGALLALALGGCSGAPRGTGGSDDDRAAVSDRPAPSTEEAPSEEPAAEEDPLDARVSASMDKLTLEQKIWQLFVVRPEAVTGVGVQTAAGEATRAALAERPVAGICYFAANLLDADQTRAMLSNTMEYGREANGLPMFLCVDEEGGTVSRVGGNPGFGVDNVGNMCEVGATGDAAYAQEVAKGIGTYLDYLGFNVDFAPDADIANNPDGTMACAPLAPPPTWWRPWWRLRCAASKKRACSARPSTSRESAARSATATTPRSTPRRPSTRFAQRSCGPSRRRSRRGVPFVMVGHLSMPNVTGDDDPASISSEIVTDLLRNELGYEGIIITDSMGMGAATEAVGVDRIAVAALSAGVDIVLMPADLGAAYQGVVDAVASGELTEERIDESVRRVIRTKLSHLEA